ncbi:hypothetical protein HS1genome_1059 [Sulfodiicoccus acidiphilus]|uniref:Menaquinone biosynthesis decarboxylase n=1 Tax=Sulfodiicoccus acidiphilus TaxID=1670455 RepID=A0A348B3B8_9CREN|nr:UbiD family decarboxylase [Sulfodiicoccus acidiphilus]BBD72670.1 hypothetical protein HS1genome_1059 [Sulfodiicoccus acidiphilus]GGT95588.1 hypothetical protein GCM10007116_11460 [Sulfodiicoccus acidiphilus]
MVFRDLREYLDHMRRRGRLIEVEEELSVELEVAELMRRACYSGTPPVLLKRIKEYPGWKILGNVFYSMSALTELFGTERLEAVTEEFVKSFMRVPVTFTQKFTSLSSALKLGRITPRLRRAEFRESNLTLADVPAIRTWPKDAGRYMTFTLTVAKDPENGSNRMGVYRIQVLNQREALIHWQAMKGGSHLARRYLESGQGRVPVALVNGVDPVTTLVGASPVPPGLDKFLFAGILRGEGLEVAKLENGVLVPARAELVMEGYVDLMDQRPEGPFGDHLGYYTPSEPYPTFKLERTYVREDPIFHVTSVGKPPLEDAWIGRAIERLFLPFIRLLVPEVVDMYLPEYGLYTGLGIFSIKKQYPGQARKVMMSLWGSGQLSLLKVIIIVDADVDVHDINKVIFALVTTVDPKRDVVVVENTITDTLDHTVPNPPLGSKLGIDATRKFKQEAGREWPEEVSSDPKVAERISSLFSRYLSGHLSGL